MLEGEGMVDVAVRLARLIKTSPVGAELGSMPKDFLHNVDLRNEWLVALSPEARKLLLMLGASTYFGTLEVTAEVGASP
jgi:hypothetical protein